MSLRAAAGFALAWALLAAGAPPVAAEPDAAADPDAGAYPAAAEAPPEGGPGGAAEPPGGSLQGSALEAYWERRLANAQVRIEVGRERLERAKAAYSRARHDRNPRGQALDEIEQQRLAAEEELREAEASLPRLVEQARRAGVPPGILRDYWDE